MIPALYLVCGIFYLKDLYYNPDSEKNLIPVLMRFQVLIHAVILFAQAMVMTQVTRSLVIDSMAFATMFLLWSSLRAKESAKLLIPVWPVAFFFSLLATVLPEAELLSEANVEYAKSIYLHIFLALVGYASFFLVTLTALLYLMQRHFLKKAISHLWMKYCPSLLQLSKIQQRALWVGIVAFTLSIGLGKLSPYLWGIEHKWSSKEILSVVIWSIYTVMAIVRHFFHTRKDWFAYSALAGFLLVVFTIFILGFFSVQPTEEVVQ